MVIMLAVTPRLLLSDLRLCSAQFFCRSRCSIMSFLELRQTQLDMPYIRCPIEREYKTLLLTISVLQRDISALSHHVKVCTVLDQPCNVSQKLENLDCRVRDCDFKSRIETMHHPCLWINTTLECFPFHWLNEPSFLLRFMSDSPSSGAVTKWQFPFHLFWHTLFITLSLRRTFVEPPGRAQLANLVYLLSTSSWRICVTAYALSGVCALKSVVGMPMACFFRCVAACHVLLATELS